eukprot:CAMPEP_0117679780 /NCGR_PEP_ID=MMETSP0804-20121206/17993_1 /TAXON_ID=1074897 /ORGANISM="Tetraselmis astigmatica, Strain CCMP880" /LENGTH=132 /DNA_ID=CAMNT_0005489217 /DNA_START=144 /DNA_END=540 /DNA_ORIENTATION=+
MASFTHGKKATYSLPPQAPAVPLSHPTLCCRAAEQRATHPGNQQQQRRPASRRLLPGPVPLPKVPTSAHAESSRAEQSFACPLPITAPLAATATGREPFKVITPTCCTCGAWQLPLDGSICGSKGVSHCFCA